MKCSSNPTSHARRRRTPLLIALLTVVALLGSACDQSNTPTSYDSVTETNFLQGCTGDTGEGTGTTLASNDACQCAYDWVVANVPYNDTNQSAPATIDGISQEFIPLDGETFSSINDALQDDPSSMPQAVQDGIASACESSGWNAAPASGSSSGGGPTTVPR